MQSYPAMLRELLTRDLDFEILQLKQDLRNGEDVERNSFGKYIVL